MVYSELLLTVEDILVKFFLAFDRLTRAPNKRAMCTQQFLEVGTAAPSAETR